MSVTLFTIPKPFIGGDAIRQRNAIGSWHHAFPGCQILFFGDDAGVAEAAAELGVEHVPGIECNDFGTPLLSWAFDTAKARARHATLGYVNADIIFLPGMADKLAPTIAQGYFIVGRRTDVDFCAPLDFTSDWASFLYRELIPGGKLAAPSCMDYFIFSRNTFTAFPRFLVGRPFWDTWMIVQANQRGLCTINVTSAVLILHQNHGYHHVKCATGPQWQGPEGVYNQNLAGRVTNAIGNTDAARFTMTASGQIVPHPLVRKLYTALMNYHRDTLQKTPSLALQTRVWLARLFSRGWERYPKLCAPGPQRQALLRWLLRP
jgi:hypothetical protein